MNIINQGLVGTRPSLQLSAFNEMSTVENTSLIALHFPYTINFAQAIPFPGNGGSMSGGGSLATGSTGTASDGFAMLLSRDVVRYNPGQGSLSRFSTIYTTGVANNEQIHGCGNGLNGFFFGYNGAAFGVLRRTGGMTEIRVLEVTTASSTLENITITLDGDVDNTVAVTASSDATKTAQEIADHSYAGLGTGWGAIAHGVFVTFISIRAEPKAGAFAISGTTADGTYSQTAAGIVPTDDWIAQAAWNKDKMDGLGSSTMLLDTTKGNNYTIRFHWSGFGSIDFFIEDAKSGGDILVHSISYSNANTEPSVDNPTFPLFMAVTNKGNTSNVVMKTTSMSAFVEGRESFLGPAFSKGVVKVLANNTDEQPILTIRNKQVYQSVINQIRLLPGILSLSSSLSNTNSSVIFRVYVDGLPLTSTSYSDVNTNSSVVEIDTASTGFDTSPSTGAAEVETLSLSANASASVQAKDSVPRLAPRRTLLITAQPSKASTTNEVGVSFGWKELT